MIDTRHAFSITEIADGVFDARCHCGHQPESLGSYDAVLLMMAKHFVVWHPAMWPGLR